MIRDLTAELKKIFDHDKLVTICKLVGLGWAEPLRLSFTADESQYAEQVNCSLIWEPWVSSGRGRIASFSLSALPGNGDVLISHYAYADIRVRGKGLGNLLCAERIAAAKAAHASAMICTVREENEIERRVLFTNGFRPMGNFKSSYMDGHRVEFWLRELA